MPDQKQAYQVKTVGREIRNRLEEGVIDGVYERGVTWRSVLANVADIAK